MSAQRAFFFRADAQDGVARSLIQSVGFEFDANALPDLERMAQHQIFRFSIDGAALPCRRNPGGTNLDATIHAVDVHEAGAADHFPGAALNGSKDHGLAALLFVESLRDDLLKVLFRFHAVGNPLEDVIDAILRDIPEELGVVWTNRFKTND